jgi:tRNA threonylcarbamoyl adenosine modification protein (Sua5/YciO/YrdC/YwlC family)
MASLHFDIHTLNPETYKIAKAAAALREGAVALYPTDTGFALGCCLSQKSAIEKIRQIRRLPGNKHLTFICDSLSHIAEYAKVSNHAYRVIKRLIPGPFTFILPATKAVPHYALDPKRKTTGIRVPENRVSRALVAELSTPIISITARHDDDEFDSPDDILAAFASVVDIVIAPNEYEFSGNSTVIDMTSEIFTIVRRGARYQEALAEAPEIEVAE